MLRIIIVALMFLGLYDWGLNTDSRDLITLGGLGFVFSVAFAIVWWEKRKTRKRR